jgi:CMP-N-acetylneuraminic acid synthetase
MYNEKTLLGLIPARGGSKGLPRKNLRPLCGKPLIAWTIEQALKSKYLDKVVVSTDDTEIAEMSKKYGAEVPFMRPKELATDEAKSVDVILHAIKFFESNNQHFDTIVLLQPTSPLRATENIDKAIETFFENNCESLVSVSEAPHSLFWSFEIKNGYLEPFLGKDFLNKRRQDLPKLYLPNGAIYISTKETIEKYISFFTDSTYPYIMPPERSIDVDTELDFRIAELLINTKIKGHKKSIILN